MLRLTIRLLMLATFFGVMWVFSKIVRAGLDAFGFYFFAVFMAVLFTGAYIYDRKHPMKKP